MLKIEISVVSPAKSRARILIVDDHEVLREGVRSLLAKIRPEWKICGEGVDGDQAVSLTHALEPDIVILDISMPRVSGLEACARMRKMGINTPVLIFTTHESESLDSEVRRAGAQGYVLKSQAARNLVLAIDTILAGGSFYGAPPAPEPAGKKPPEPGIVRRTRLAQASSAPQQPR
jgi:DNA-binding NarL/FixJ family response regulator